MGGEFVSRRILPVQYILIKRRVHPCAGIFPLSMDHGQVSPWYSYLLVHLPKITLFGLPLALYALTTGAAGRGLGGMMATCILGLVGGLSCLAHKVGRVWDKRDFCVIMELGSICRRSNCV
jgi:hypothetical protein